MAEVHGKTTSITTALVVLVREWEETEVVWEWEIEWVAAAAAAVETSGMTEAEDTMIEITVVATGIMAAVIEITGEAIEIAVSVVIVHKKFKCAHVRCFISFVHTFMQ